MTDAENDIGTALMRLRSAYAKHGIPAPDILEYSDPEKARKAEILLRNATYGTARYSLSQFGPRRSVALAGFTIRHEVNAVEDFDAWAYEVRPKGSDN